MKPDHIISFFVYIEMIRYIYIYIICICVFLQPKTHCNAFLICLCLQHAVLCSPFKKIKVLPKIMLLSWRKSNLIQRNNKILRNLWYRCHPCEHKENGKSFHSRRLLKLNHKIEHCERTSNCHVDKISSLLYQIRVN